jgi:hypothetical protein
MTTTERDGHIVGQTPQNVSKGWLEAVVLKEHGRQRRVDARIVDVVV